MDRRQLRAARRADASGSGPTLEERDAPRFPGAGGAFALFGEVLMVGLLVTIAGLPIVTLPAALAAGIRHLRRYVAAEASPAAWFWQDVKKALPGGLVVGFAGLVLTLLLLLDIDLARSGALPGGGAVEIVGWVGLAVVAVALLAAAGAWSPRKPAAGQRRSAASRARSPLTSAAPSISPRPPSSCASRPGCWCPSSCPPSAVQRSRSSRSPHVAAAPAEPGPGLRATRRRKPPSEPTP